MCGFTGFVGAIENKEQVLENMMNTIVQMCIRDRRYTMPYKEVTGILTDIGTSVPILHTLLFNKRCF